MRIALSRGALRPGQGDDLEPGMPVQELDEALSHRAGGAQHGDGDGLLRGTGEGGGGRVVMLLGHALISWGV